MDRRSKAEHSIQLAEPRASRCLGGLTSHGNLFLGQGADSLGGECVDTERVFRGTFGPDGLVLADDRHAVHKVRQVFEIPLDQQGQLRELAQAALPVRKHREPRLQVFAFGARPVELLAKLRHRDEVLGLLVAVAPVGKALAAQDLPVLAGRPRDAVASLRVQPLGDAGGHEPEGLEFATEWPRVGEGCEERLRAWLESHPEARLVVVDTLKKVRPQTDVRKGVYDADYEALEPLLPLAAEFGVAVVVVHHTRKTPGADPLEEVSGSYGLSGGVDGVLVMKRERGSREAFLHVTGRDVEEEADLALMWDAKILRWTLMGTRKITVGARSASG